MPASQLSVGIPTHNILIGSMKFLERHIFTFKKKSQLEKKKYDVFTVGEMLKNVTNLPFHKMYS